MESQRESLSSISSQPRWDLCWAKCNWDRFSSEYFGFPLPVSIIPALLLDKNFFVDNKHEWESVLWKQNALNGKFPCFSYAMQGYRLNDKVQQLGEH